MLKIYKNKEILKDDLELIELNDVYFNTKTSQKLSKEKAEKIVQQIDYSKLISKFQIQSKFSGEILNIDKLSTGCKTALNILFNPNKIFSIKECGDNAVKVIYQLKKGKIYSEYPIIPFEFEKVTVIDKHGESVISDYNELKEWWENE